MVHLCLILYLCYRYLVLISFGSLKCIHLFSLGAHGCFYLSHFLSLFVQILDLPAPVLCNSTFFLSNTMFRTCACVTIRLIIISTKFCCILFCNLSGNLLYTSHHRESIGLCKVHKRIRIFYRLSLPYCVLLWEILFRVFLRFYISFCSVFCEGHNANTYRINVPCI